ncbi:MAG: hypothetical protein Q9179_006171 [Wetmoreana sp. 5 TL-2023]
MQSSPEQTSNLFCTPISNTPYPTLSEFFRHCSIGSEHQTLKSLRFNSLTRISPVELPDEEEEEGEVEAEEVFVDSAAEPVAVPVVEKEASPDVAVGVNPVAVPVGKAPPVPVANTFPVEVGELPAVPVGNARPVPVEDTSPAEVEELPVVLVGNAPPVLVEDTSPAEVGELPAVPVGNASPVLVEDTSPADVEELPSVPAGDTPPVPVGKLPTCVPVGNASPVPVRNTSPADKVSPQGRSLDEEELYEDVGEGKMPLAVAEGKKMPVPVGKDFPVPVGKDLPVPVGNASPVDVGEDPPVLVKEDSPVPVGNDLAAATEPQGTIGNGTESEDEERVPSFTEPMLHGGKGKQTRRE